MSYHPEVAAPSRRQSKVKYMGFLGLRQLSLFVLWIWIVYFTTISIQQKLPGPKNNKLTHFLDESQTSKRDPTTTTQQYAPDTLFPEKEKPTRVKFDHPFLNSESWLRGPRVENAEDADFTAPFQLFGRLDGPATSSENEARDASLIQNVLRETLCFNTSRWVLDTSDARLWTTRLVYLAIYWHQHAAAFQERSAVTELGTKNLSTRRSHYNDYNVSFSDWECPTARFLVTSLSEKGIGANFRLTAVSALKAALATNRVAVFANNIGQAKPLFLQQPWALASCPRRDFQCFFRPLTPCVLTRLEISQAHTLVRSERRRLFRDGTLPVDHENDRVVILDAGDRPQRNPPNLQSTLYGIGKQIIQMHPWLQTIPQLKQGMDRILRSSPNSSNNMYEGDYEISNGLMMYAMRPLPHQMKRINSIVDQVLMSHFVQPEQIIGLPIRGSDKCIAESECFSAEQYITAISELYSASWKTKMLSDRVLSNQNSVALLVTTEDQTLLHELDQLRRSAGAGNDFPYRLVENPFDTVQGTGYITHVSQSYSDLDHVMASALSSLKLQLYPRLAMGNCCSNFHMLLRDLRMEGCGPFTDDSFICMQDHPNEDHRMCCAWDHSERCKTKMSQRTKSSREFSTSHLPSHQKVKNISESQRPVP